MTTHAAQTRPLIPAHIFWPGLVLALLTLSVTLCITTIVLATGDASVSIEPAYYERALAWDDRKREQAASDALGWRCDIGMAPDAARGGGRTLTIGIESAAGPVEGATVTVEAFAHARASRRHQLEAIPASGGQYQAELPAPQPGLWTVSIRARRGQDVLTTTRRLSIAAAEGAR